MAHPPAPVSTALQNRGGKTVIPGKMQRRMDLVLCRVDHAGIGAPPDSDSDSEYERGRQVWYSNMRPPSPGLT